MPCPKWVCCVLAFKVSLSCSGRDFPVFGGSVFSRVGLSYLLKLNIANLFLKDINTLKLFKTEIELHYQTSSDTKNLRKIFACGGQDNSAPHLFKILFDTELYYQIAPNFKFY